MSNIKNTLSARLTYLRERNNWSKTDVAKRMGFSVQKYANYEYGIRQPDNESLITLADFYGVTVDYLLGRKVKDDLLVAAHMDDDLTDEQKKEIEEYIEFKKAQYRKQHEKD
jgi:Predicted transcriptional regulators